MKGRSNNSAQKTLWDMTDVISSAALPDGSMPSDSQDGPKEEASSRPVSPVSRSRRRAGGKARKTSVTSGPSSSISSVSLNLQRSLASRLKALSDTDGSIEFLLTWDEKVTPAARPFCLLRARGRRTSDTAFSGGLFSWPTTRQSDGDNGLRSAEGAEKEYERKGDGADLPTIAQLADVSGWATPKSSDTAPPDLLQVTPRASPAARDYKDGRASQETLDRNSRPLNEQAVNFVSGTTSESSTAATARAGVFRLNPSFSRWLMGIQPSWDHCSPGWKEWEEVQRLLALYYALPEETAPED
jgi:hypothetical protein